MTNIRVEMHFYRCSREYVVMVLFDDEAGESASLNWYFTSKRKAEKCLASVEAQYADKKEA